MRFDVITIFPKAFESPLHISLLGKAISAGLVTVATHDLRGFADDPNRRVDDEPFGGGAGMVMKAQPIIDSVSRIKEPGGKVILMSASGRPFTQSDASDLATLDQLVIVCGRYEGVDERVIDITGAEAFSVGPFVLSGGEFAALAVIDSVARLLPGVMGNDESLSEESFTSGLLEYPQYTRPAEYSGVSVPEVLLSGDHAKIAAWRREQALRRTFEMRPELLVSADLTEAEAELIARWRAEG